MEKDLEMLDALFQFATEGIIVVDTKGEIVMVNPKAEKLFGYSKDEITGQKIEVLIPARFRNEHVDHRNHYMEKPRPRSMGKGMDLFARKKDGGEFPVEVSLSNFMIDEGRYVMSFIIDITERKKQEIQLKLATERLQQTSDALSLLNAQLENKVQERTEELAKVIKELDHSKKEVVKALEKEKELNVLKSRFVTTASHEFRTPLGTILSSASLISRYNEEGDEEKRNRHIDRIKSAVNNLTEILNDFLSLDKLEEGIVRNNPVMFEMEPFITHLVDELRSILKNGQTLTYSPGEKVTSVVLDKQFLKNVLINLISNAIKYSPEDKPILVTSEIVKNNVHLNIIDSGIGIPKEEHSHIFERFYRAQNSGNIQGTGLGLNIVKKYIELMKGEIFFDSKVNEGSTFTIVLPLSN
jgi:PAS domain S-box-containing protein